jgi:hypothetical protein
MIELAVVYYVDMKGDSLVGVFYVPEARNLVEHSRPMGI